MVGPVVKAYVTPRRCPRLLGHGAALFSELCHLGEIDAGSADATSIDLYPAMQLALIDQLRDVGHTAIEDRRGLLIRDPLVHSPCCPDLRP